MIAAHLPSLLGLGCDGLRLPVNRNSVACEKSRAPTLNGGFAVANAMRKGRRSCRLGGLRQKARLRKSATLPGVLVAVAGWEKTYLVDSGTVPHRTAVT